MNDLSMSGLIDLRSDTVTKPTPAMRRAIAEAEVGDDVLSEDPTVNRLEEKAAEIMGKPAAVFVASGTMGNQAAIGAHTSPGQEIICDDRSHVVLYEMGMAAQLSGCLLRTVSTSRGILSVEQIEARLRTSSDHYRGTGLVTLENSHNMAGGTVYPLERLTEISAAARRAGIPVHMDGARVFNAAEAAGVSVREIAATVDSVSFCLSKGLGAPVGSVLVGSKDFIEEARLYRKGLGGGMRQAGVIAAAGIVALDETPPLMAQDHANARLLAERIIELPELELDGPPPETNIVFCRPAEGSSLSPAEIRARLKEQGVLVSGDATRLRMVTHRDASAEDCRRAADAFAAAVSTSAVS